MLCRDADLVLGMTSLPVRALCAASIATPSVLTVDESLGIFLGSDSAIEEGRKRVPSINYAEALLRARLPPSQRRTKLIRRCHWFGHAKCGGIHDLARFAFLTPLQDDPSVQYAIDMVIEGLRELPAPTAALRAVKRF
jgi:hypothetical protein